MRACLEAGPATRADLISDVLTKASWICLIDGRPYLPFCYGTALLYATRVDPVIRSGTGKRSEPENEILFRYGSRTFIWRELILDKRNSDSLSDEQAVKNLNYRLNMRAEGTRAYMRDCWVDN